MADKIRSSITEPKLPAEKQKLPVKKKANITKNYLDLTVLVRSIQRAEENETCFRSGLQDCDQLKCAWRPYCLEE